MCALRQSTLRRAPWHLSRRAGAALGCSQALQAHFAPRTSISQSLHRCRRSELVQLALWLMHERGEGEQSAYRPLVASLPQGTLSPLLWTEAERADLLRGSPILVEAENRLAGASRGPWGP